MSRKTSIVSSWLRVKKAIDTDTALIAEIKIKVYKRKA